MNTKELENALQQIGLSRKSKDVYLSLLNYGQMTMAEISRKAGIKRTTAYEGVRELLTVGFAGQSIKGRTKFYMPENPKKIYAEVASRQKKFQKALPQLEGLYSQARHSPSVEYYEGSDGMRKIYSEILDTFSPIYGFFSPGKFFDVFNDPKTISLFYKVIEKNEVVLRDLIQFDSQGVKLYKQRKKIKNTQVQARLLPKDFDISVSLLITGDKVAMISLNHFVAVLITNKEIADFQRSVHKFIWKHSK